jgi:hypothetical protein
MNLGYSYRYYSNLLNQKKDTGKIIGLIPIPNGRPYQFIVSTVLVFNLLGVMLNENYFILQTLSLFLCFDYFFRFKLREDMLDRCVCDEVYMDYRAEVEEEILNDEDRLGIFDWNYGMKACKPSFIQNVKYYNKEVLEIIAFEVVMYTLIF